ncbi:4-hydroxy-tetrahydrodipicolinate reductase 2, chloroplastic [Orobanche minor]
MAFIVKASLGSSYATWRQHGDLLYPFPDLRIAKSSGTRLGCKVATGRKLSVTMARAPAQSIERAPTVASKNVGIPIMVNGCTGKMGRAVLEAAMAAGLNPVPIALGGLEDSGRILDFGGKQVEVFGDSDRESILSSVFDDYPNLIVVDYTVPAAVNGFYYESTIFKEDEIMFQKCLLQVGRRESIRLMPIFLFYNQDNAALYCKVGVPFVMGTTGGDRELLYKTVADSKVYAVISPQMGKQVVAFLAAMEIMAEQFPGAFSGYDLQVMESHQAGKLDISGTAKAVISCFQKLGASFELEQVQQIRDPRLQVEVVGVPEEHLSGHAFHMYHLTSPDGTVSFEFQHNVCGRSIYAEGTVDAILFLAKKVSSEGDKRIYNMIDVLREGNMR